MKAKAADMDGNGRIIEHQHDLWAHPDRRKIAYSGTTNDERLLALPHWCWLAPAEGTA